MTNDIYVQYYDMPTSVKSFCRANPDGSYTIVINAKLSDESRLARYRHEIKHIKNGDFDYDKNENVQVIETRAHAPNPEPGQAVVWMTQEEIQERIAQIRKRKRKLDAAIKRRKKLVEELEREGYDFFAAAEERWLDPEKTVF